VAGLTRILLGVAAVGILAAAAGTWWAWQQLEAPGPSAEPVIVDIAPGNSLSRISRVLESEGVIRHAMLFEWYGRVSGLATQVRAGEYRFPGRSTPREVMARMIGGETVLHSLTVIEGWTYAQMRAAIAAHPAIRHTLDEVSGEAVMARLGRAGEHPEGWFLPETYRFPRGTSDLELLRTAHQAMVRALQAAWETRRDSLPLESPYEALILASIVEKETGLAEERGRVAGVFIRRLERGMRLQTDPTVAYGVGPDFEGRLRRVHLQTDTPYNTYTRHGLPPTPIALPGKAALAAAVQPVDGPWLYFVATGRPDGSHYFSTTLAEHNRAVQKYLETLRARRQAE